MTVSLVLVVIRTNFQPWYLLYIVPFTPFLKDRYYALIVSIVFPFFALAEYIPFLYEGDWNPPIPNVLFLLTALGAFLSIIFIIWKPFILKLFASNNK